MFDGFWSGLIGGIFGPALAQWMSRYKYRTIFISAMLGVHVGCFVVGAFSKGLQFAIQVIIEKTFTVVGIFVPMGIALIVVFIAFIGSVSVPKEKGGE